MQKNLIVAADVRRLKFPKNERSEPFYELVIKRTASPLTPALSPLRGEGETHGAFAASFATFGWFWSYVAPTPYRATVALK